MRSLLAALGLLAVASAQSCPTGFEYVDPIKGCLGPADPTHFPYDINEMLCQGFGGHLVKLQNSFTNSIVWGYMSRDFPDSRLVHIGAKRNAASWYWRDGLPVTWFNFGRGPYTGEDCATMNMQDGRWDSLNCNQRTLGMCETAPYPCPTGWIYSNATQMCYYQGFNATYPNAKNYCVSKGGNLASIHSQDEYDFIIRMIETDQCVYYGNEYYSGMALIGGIYTSSNGSMAWMDGTPYDFTKSFCYGNNLENYLVRIVGTAHFCRNACQNAWYNRGTSATDTTTIHPSWICKAPPLVAWETPKAKAARQEAKRMIAELAEADKKGKQ